MLFLLFQIGDERYALNTEQVEAVLPLVHWKTIPQAPSGVRGVFNYHGAPVPLIDLGEIALGKPSRALMSTRIVLVNYVVDAGESMGEGAGETHLLGLLAEQATTTLRRSESDFVDAGITVETMPYLGPVITEANGIIQRVEINRLLPADVANLLFHQLPEHDLTDALQ